MAGLLRTVVVFLALASSPAFAQQVDPNFQALLAGLMQGTPVTLLTPLADGTVQVTSLTAPGQRSAADAAVLIQRARTELQNLGVTQPTGQQLAAALAGGTLTVPTGDTRIVGALPAGTNAVVSSQVVNATSLPTIVGAPRVSPGGVSAAVGGTAPVVPNGTPATAPTVSQPQPIVTPMPPLIQTR